jgi:carbon storage regulator
LGFYFSMRAIIQEGHLMLVLTRRTGESIIIGEGIKLTVVNVGPGRVKIGIVAPPNVRIDREEIHTRIQQEQAADVLVTVSGDALDNQSGQNTVIGSGAETGILHNRIAADLPSDASVTAGTETVGKVSKFHPPRKPR